MSSMVLLILGAGRGVGRSVTAAAFADSLALAGVPVTLCAITPPYLATDLRDSSSISTSDHITEVSAEVLLRHGQRPSGAAVLALDSPNPQLREPLGFFGRHLVPDPSVWLAAAGESQVLVVDASWDSLEVLGERRDHMAAWLQQPSGVSVYPMIVTPASRPAVAATSQLLAAIEGYRAALAGRLESGAGIGPSSLLVPRSRSGTAEAFTHVASTHGSVDVKDAVTNGQVTHLPEDDKLLAGIGEKTPVGLLNAVREALYRCGAAKEAA